MSRSVIAQFSRLAGAQYGLNRLTLGDPHNIGLAAGDHIQAEVWGQRVEAETDAKAAVPKPGQSLDI